MANPPEGFRLRTRDIEVQTGVKASKINRYAASRVIPQDLRTQAGGGHTWWFKQEAVDWVNFIKKLTDWNVTESQMAEYFASAIDKCGTPASALASLQAAYEATRNFPDLKARFEANSCI
jgi:hypothetical protein